MQARFESSRDRTRERSLITLEELVSNLESRTVPKDEEEGGQEGGGGGQGDGTAVGEGRSAIRRRRLRWCFALSSWFPPVAMLKGELAHALIAVGAVGAGMKLLEELEVRA